MMNLHVRVGDRFDLRATRVLAQVENITISLNIVHLFFYFFIYIAEKK
jgi:hypothetical protein